MEIDVLQNQIENLQEDMKSLRSSDSSHHYTPNDQGGCPPGDESCCSPEDGFFSC